MVGNDKDFILKNNTTRLGMSIQNRDWTGAREIPHIAVRRFLRTTHDCAKMEEFIVSHKDPEIIRMYLGYTVKDPKDFHEILRDLVLRPVDAKQVVFREVFAAWSGDKIIGVCIAMLQHDRTCEIAFLVLPHLRGRGIGKELLVSAIRWAGRQKSVKTLLAQHIAGNGRMGNLLLNHHFEEGKGEIPGERVKILPVKHGMRGALMFNPLFVMLFAWLDSTAGMLEWMPCVTRGFALDMADLLVWVRQQDEKDTRLAG